MNQDMKLDSENAEKILREGWNLFQVKGYRGISMDELCCICGITKPTLYYYFHDKENLFVQVLIHQLKSFHNILEMTGTLEQKLETFAAAVLQSFQTEYTSLIHDREHLKDPQNQQAVREAFHACLFDPLNQVMQQGIDEGLLQGERPETLTLVFLGMINNFIQPGRELNRSRADLARELAHYFLFGVAKRE